MEKSDSIVKLVKAIGAFQAEVPIILKNTNGYNYKYADLATIMKTIKPILEKNKLTIIQTVSCQSAAETSVTTMICCEEEFISDTIYGSIDKNKGKGMSYIQGQGNVITYLRRYSISAMLGLVTDVDIDGAVTTENVDSSSKKQYKENWEVNAGYVKSVSGDHWEDLKKFLKSTSSPYPGLTIKEIFDKFGREILDHIQKNGIENYIKDLPF